MSKSFSGMLHNRLGVRVQALKHEIQRARQDCPFFRLEQMALQGPKPHAFDKKFLERPTRVLPELSQFNAEGGRLPLRLEDMLMAVRDFPALIVNIQFDFSSQLQTLEQVRRALPEHYLIFRHLIVDEYQILAARAQGADAVIFSPELLEHRRLQIYCNKTRFWGMEPILEAHHAQHLLQIQELPVRCVLLTAPPFEKKSSWQVAQLLAEKKILSAFQHVILEQQQLPPQTQQLGISQFAPGLNIWQAPEPQGCLAQFEKDWPASAAS